MDQTLKNAFSGGHALFGGVTFRSTRNLPERELLALNRLTLGSFDSTADLRILQDWSFHDGFVTDSAPTSLHDLAELFRDEATMVANLTDDTLVSTAVYPEDLSFLWRWGRLSNWNEPFVGSFDITFSEGSTRVSEAFPTFLEAQPADEFWSKSCT